VDARVATARERAGQVLPLVQEIQAAGVTTLAEIARELTRRGVPTPRGAGAWQAVQVTRVLKVMERADTGSWRSVPARASAVVTR
jgi:hypothetical protein